MNDRLSVNLIPDVTALEYLRGVSRAQKQAGLTVTVAHVDMGINKLLNEMELPKLKAIQILNKLDAAVASENKDTVELTIDEVRLLLVCPRFYIKE